GASYERIACGSRRPQRESCTGCPARLAGPRRVRYGGTERVIFALTEELVRLGHDVTLFAAGTSRTSARLIPCSPRPLWDLDPSESVAYPHGQLDRVRRQLRQFDIVHTHSDRLLCLARDTMATPLVATLH